MPPFEHPRPTEAADARPDDSSVPRGAGPAATSPGLRVKIIGCGRSQRRDDQLGLEVARRLARRPSEGCEVCLSEDPGTDLLLDLDGVRLLVLVDAAACGPHLPAGRIRRLCCRPEAPGSARSAFERLPLRTACSTHLLSIGDGLRVAEQLGVLPREVWIYVVGAAEFGHGTELSPAIERAAARLVGRIRADVRAWLKRPEAGHA